MSKNPHLVPTPVLNKNGVQTTVYKKPEQSGASTVIPAPALAQNSTLDPRIIKQVKKYYVPNSRTLSPNQRQFADTKIDDTLSHLAKHPKPLQEAILTLLENDDIDHTHHVLLLQYLLNDEPERVLNEYVAYHEHLTRDNYLLLLNTLRQYDQLPKVDDYSTLSDKEQKQVNALLGISARLINEARFLAKVSGTSHASRNGLPLELDTSNPYHNDRDDAAVITGDELVRFIMDNHEKAQRIGDIILERATGDAELIAEIINSETPALSEGVL